MIDITYENFQTELIDASTRVPVLLDIWAEWCGPCKSLGPVLEQLEVEYAGRFILAKVNADQYAEIAQQLSKMFGVRSIPFCVMFKDGNPIDGFVGALPAEQIRGFLDQHVASEDALASAEETAQAEAAMAEGQTASAHELLQDALARDPGNDEARFDLIKLQIAEGDLDGARATFEPMANRAQGPVPEMRVSAFGRYIEAFATARQARAPSALAAAIEANKRDFEARFELACMFIAVGRFPQAMDELLEIIMRDKAWSDELARKTYIALLEVMSAPPVKPAPSKAPAPGAAAADGKPKLELTGKMETNPTDPVIEQYRRKLSMALF